MQHRSVQVKLPGQAQREAHTRLQPALPEDSPHQLPERPKVTILRIDPDVADSGAVLTTLRSRGEQAPCARGEATTSPLHVQVTDTLITACQALLHPTCPGRATVGRATPQETLPLGDDDSASGDKFREGSSLLPTRGVRQLVEKL